MIVNAIEYDTATGAERALGERDLRDMMGDDDDGYQAALAEIGRAGRAWIGGGAAPLVLVTPQR